MSKKDVFVKQSAVQCFSQKLLHLWSILMFMQQLLYWSLLSTGSETMPLFCSVLNNRGKLQIQIQIQVWSILMFIVYAAIALLPLLSCRHCPSCTPCKTQYNRGIEQMEVSECQKLIVEILYSMVYVLYRLINVQTRLPFFGK